MRRVIETIKPRMKDIDDLMLGNPILLARTCAGRRPLPGPHQGVRRLGPIARASGVDVDLRRDAPIPLVWRAVRPGGPGKVVTRQEGDGMARLEVLLSRPR